MVTPVKAESQVTLASRIGPDIRASFLRIAVRFLPQGSKFPDFPFTFHRANLESTTGRMAETNCFIVPNPGTSKFSKRRRCQQLVGFMVEVIVITSLITMNMIPASASNSLRSPSSNTDLKPLVQGANKSVDAPANKQLLITSFFNYVAGFGRRPVKEKPCRCGIRDESGRFEELVEKSGREARAGLRKTSNTEPTRINEFPWRVSINPSGNKSQSICAGALISKEWVLTSASCVHEIVMEHILVDLGDHNLSTENEAVNVLVSPVAKIIHEDYLPRTTAKSGSNSNTEFGDNNIALLKLAEPIEEANIIPVCLPRDLDPMDLAVTKVMTSGWGRNPDSLNFGGKSVAGERLNKAVLTYYSNKEYRKNIAPNYFPSLRVPPGDNLVFTFDTNKGIYPLDSGTTIEHYDLRSGLYYAVGVADAVQVKELKNGETSVLRSWTDVTKYVDWIQNKTAGARFCNPR